MNKKRFVAQSQGDIKRVWNVLDTATNTYMRFGITGMGDEARREAFALAKKLNNDKRRKLKNEI